MAANRRETDRDASEGWMRAEFERGFEAGIAAAAEVAARYANRTGGVGAGAAWAVHSEILEIKPTP